jgi:uncharacterized protein (TIGR03086 family)
LLLDHVSDSVGVMHEAITTGCIGAGLAPGDDRPGPDPVGGLYRQAGRLLAACAPAGLAGLAGQPVTIGDRELAARMAVAAGAIEIAVHGWDISVACGNRRPVPPDLAALLLPIAPLLITPRTRAGLFADPVPVAGRACPGDRLVAFLGRQPYRPAPPDPGGSQPRSCRRPASRRFPLARLVYPDGPPDRQAAAARRLNGRVHGGQAAVHVERDPGDVGGVGAAEE